MTQQHLAFEQPLTERMRLFLRVEHLAKQIEHYRNQENHWESGTALLLIIELFSLFERSDIKGEVSKEIERHIQRLMRLNGSEKINYEQLQHILEELHHQSFSLQQQTGRIGQTLREDELLNSVRQRVAIPGGTCNFDTPAYHYWLHTSFETRQALFDQWLAPFMPVAHALMLILHLTRNSANYCNETAYNGFYQKNLDTHLSCPLIQVLIDKHLSVYPEMSGGKYRVSMRFWQFAPNIERALPCNLDVPFEIRCCLI